MPIVFDESEEEAKTSIVFDKPEPAKASSIKFDDETEEPTTGEIVKGVGAEMATSVAGSVAGGIIGGALGSFVPVLGTAAGAVVGTAIGGFAGGVLGSLWAQDIEGQEDVSVGRALGAGVVSAIPLGGAAAKGVKGAAKITGSMVAKAAGREAVKGAALGTTEATIRTVVDEGRMPTKEEYATYAGAGALFGSALGAVTPKISKSVDKFLGKSAAEIDDALIKGDLTYRDFKPILEPEAQSISSISKKYSNDLSKLEVRETENSIVVDSLIVMKSKRNQGIGSSVLDDISRYADSKGKPVTLTPSGLGANRAEKTERLNEFYKRIGFSENLSKIDGQDLIKQPKPKMEGIFQDKVAQMQSRARSKVAAEALTSPAPITTMKNKLLSILAPSRVVGKEARNEALNFRKRVASAEELGGRIERRVAKEIKKDPTVEGKVNAFLKGGDLDPSLGSLNDELIVYRSKMNELQGELIHQLELDHMASMESGKLNGITEKILKLREEAQSMTGKRLNKANKKIAKMEGALDATPNLIAKIKRSRDLNQYSRREYRMYTDSEFVPDIRLRAKAQEEIAQNMLKRNKSLTPETATAKANKHLDDLENKSARVRKAEARQGSGRQPYEAPLKQKSNVGKAEKAWLGEITDTGERMRGTLSGVAKLVARKQTDRNVADILSKYGLAVPADRQIPGMVELRLKAGETTGLHVNPEVQASVNRLYLDGAQMRSNNPIIAGIQDLYSSAVGLSKATKVLLNPPSYAVQVYGNTMNLLGMGVNPFGGAGKGIRLALSEYGGLEYLMSKAGKTKRVDFLKELNDMAKYGIKGENIMESDIRDAFERGLFSKMADKPVGFFGKAYSVPDTVGRYVGWKAQQKMLKKVYPHLGDEDLKRLGAEVINDTYQNYDRLSGTIKSLSRMGVMPQFASFTAEFMRNQLNQGKIIGQMLRGTFGADLGIDISKANVAAMRREGAKRLAALSTVYGSTIATLSAINRDGGIEEGDEEHIRELVPSWDKHKSLAMRLSDDGKKMSYANVSYIAPQALGLAAFDAGMSGEPIENLASMLVEELVGDGSFVNREMMAAINNRNNRGQKISSEENDLKNAMDRLQYFVTQTFKPGAAREAKKMDEALRGVGDLTTRQVLARQVGYRVNTMDFAENAKYLMMEHKDNADMSKREFTKARDKGTMRPEDLEQLYQSANEARKESMAQVARRNANLINRGYTESERIQVMKDAGLGSKDILATLEGRYDPILRVAIPSTNDVYEGLEGSMGDKRTQIRQIMREDSKLGNNLMRAWERERKSDRLGSDKYDLFKNLDTIQKVSYINAQPNPSATLQDLRRNRLVSDEVVRAVRLSN
jgi:GNAT superfamily N-acetyltransferase